MPRLPQASSHTLGYPVTGTRDDSAAGRSARGIANSPLIKTAIASRTLQGAGIPSGSELKLTVTVG